MERSDTPHLAVGGLKSTRQFSVKRSSYQGLFIHFTGIQSCSLQPLEQPPPAPLSQDRMFNARGQTRFPCTSCASVGTNLSFPPPHPSDGQPGALLPWRVIKVMAANSRTKGQIT